MVSESRSQAPTYGPPRNRDAGAALLVRLMISPPPKPKYPPGTRLRVTQFVRVGHRRWLTQVEGVFELDGRRPVGGIEMGGKASYCQQPTLRLRRDDGELVEVAVDEDTKVEPLATPPA